MQQSHIQQRAFAAYRDATAMVSPAQQIVMLYDGAIGLLRESRRAIEERRIEARFGHVSKARRVIGALQDCLDHERGGEVAGLLDRYYRYVLHRLSLIDARNDAAICDELVARLGEMRASWAAIAEMRTPPSPATAAAALDA